MPGVCVYLNKELSVRITYAYIHTSRLLKNIYTLSKGYLHTNKVSKDYKP